MLPNKFARTRIQAMKVSPGTDGKGTSLIDRDACSGPCRVTDISIRGFVLHLPKQRTLGRIETKDAFCLIAIGHLAIHDINTTICNGRSAIPRPDIYGPSQRVLPIRQVVANSLFIPTTIALRPTPLWPIIGLRTNARQHRRQQYCRQAPKASNQHEESPVQGKLK